MTGWIYAVAECCNLKEGGLLPPSLQCFAAQARSKLIASSGNCPVQSYVSVFAMHQASHPW
jgi:hypothetical protein